MTTARKAVTLLLSYLIFTKPLTEQHGSGLLLITMGIVLKLLPENKQQKKLIPMLKSEQPCYNGESRTQDVEEEEEKRPLV